MRMTLGRQKRQADSRAARVPPYNAAGTLTIPSPYGDSQVMHPDVLYVPGGLHGYAYWMAATPYPAGDNTKENPSVFVSQDGLTWSAPPGVTNPVAPNTGGYNSDPELLLDPVDGSTLYLVYRKVGSVETIDMRSSTDGVTWSAPTTIWSGTIASTSQELSPAIVWDGTKWVSWVVDGSRAGAPIKRRTCLTLTGSWSAAADVAYTNPTIGATTGQPWHINVTRDSGVFHMIVNEAQTDNPGIKGIRLASSLDGITWSTATSQAIVRRVGEWDEVPYRSAGLVRSGGDLLKLWYSANGGSSWATGYTEVPAADTTRYFPVV